MQFFGGIEGGATHSCLVICNADGECVAKTTGLGTNHWMLGIPECARRIADMVNRAKSDAQIPNDTRLSSLGLSLSGCEQEATNQKLARELKESFPDLADSYVVCSDTVGSVFTASPIGGLVLISGTGSNALLRNPDGTSYSCGGWGNFLGDEGSAWYISYRAMKIVFDDVDNFEKAKYPTDKAWELIKQHFNVKTRLDLLDHCYAKFDKPFFASLCQKLSKAADEGDALCLFLFQEAGHHLARSTISLLPRVHEELVKSGDLHIVCVGSVWNSWHLMREGFLHELRKIPLNYGVKFVKITKSMAFGAVYIGADGINFKLPRNYSDNYKVMFHYTNSPIKNGIANGHSNL
ncbi:N-acetyl-D-glucosamine kinase [Eupeodes corollae]|uniref:N-acetyl-D-glucosamine kinase n=1 Tax=Eupeodes corollae TaxID=290404 RepID=UPI00248FB181|nr:N-acetyl-D-glucosamine kinase [Eupeodes corollae]